MSDGTDDPGGRPEGEVGPPRAERPGGGALAQLVRSAPGGAILLRHARLIALCALVAPLMAAVAHLVLPKVYVSQARVLMMLGREFQGDGGRGGSSSSMYRLAEALNSEVEILTSHRLAAQVVEEVGVAALFPKVAASDKTEEARLASAAEKLLKAMDVTAIAESSVLRIALGHSDAGLARDALETLLEAFLESHIDVFKTREIEVARQVLDRALAEAAAAEAAEAAFWSAQGIFDPVQERGLLLERREALATQRRTLAAERARLDRPTDPDEPPRPGATEPSDTETNLVTLRAEETRLLSNYYSTSAAVQAVRAQIFALELQLEREREARGAALDGEIAGLDDELGSIESELEELRTHGQALRDLARRVTNADLRVAAAHAELASAETDSLLSDERVSSVRIFDPPTLPLSPLGLSLSVKVVLGGMVGLLLGVASALGAHLLEEASRAEA
ncbi:MAG: Wzz/FepE/Etk N-terminal domain-containing protein [Planctomycetota bacterium]